MIGSSETVFWNELRLHFAILDYSPVETYISQNNLYLYIPHSYWVHLFTMTNWTRGISFEKVNHCNFREKILVGIKNVSVFHPSPKARAYFVSAVDQGSGQLKPSQLVFFKTNEFSKKNSLKNWFLLISKILKRYKILCRSYSLDLIFISAYFKERRDLSFHTFHATP